MLVTFGNMIAHMLSNKRRNSIVSESFIRERIKLDNIEVVKTKLNNIEVVFSEDLINQCISQNDFFQ